MPSGVSFVSSASGLTNALSSSLIVRGTAAFRLPANSTECSVESLINLEILEMAF
jgi:hypothetical protein